MPTALPGLQITRRPRFRVLSCFFTLSFLRFSSLLFVGSTGTTASLNDEKIERVFFSCCFQSSLRGLRNRHLFSLHLRSLESVPEGLLRCLQIAIVACRAQDRTLARLAPRTSSSQLLTRRRKRRLLAHIVIPCEPSVPEIDREKDPQQSAYHQRYD